MGINFDDFWILGSVRVRASAPDPLSGLRGRAYIAARKLDQNRVQRIKDPAAEQVEGESRENLIKAINQRPAIAGRKLKHLIQYEEAEAARTKFVFASGSMDFLKGSGDRRFWPLPELTAEEQ